MIKHIWRLWALALGAKSGCNSSEADRVAMIRTSLVLLNVLFGIINTLVGLVIVAGVLRHWHD
jgi:hypothetical protein